MDTWNLSFLCTFQWPRRVDRSVLAMRPILDPARKVTLQLSHGSAESLQSKRSMVDWIVAARDREAKAMLIEEEMDFLLPRERICSIELSGRGEDCWSKSDRDLLPYEYTERGKSLILCTNESDFDSLHVLDTVWLLGQHRTSPVREISLPLSIWFGLQPSTSSRAISYAWETLPPPR